MLEVTLNGNVISQVNDTNEYTLESNKAVITADVNDYKSSYIVNGNTDLNIGLNAFTIVVTAEDSSQKTYTLNINRVIGKSNVTLDLYINGKKIKFNKNNTYKTSKKFKKNKINLTYTLSDINSSLKIYKGKQELTNDIKLKKGMNKIRLVITDSNGNENTYKLNIKRKSKKKKK